MSDGVGAEWTGDHQNVLFRSLFESCHTTTELIPARGAYDEA